MLFVEIMTEGVEFAQRHAAWFGSGGFVDEDNGFGFDSQAAMMGKDAGDMNPVSVAVFVRGATGSGIGDEAEREAALAVVVDGAETDFVVAFVDGAIVDEFRGVEKVEAVHATAA
jgi:hypothetical protein